MNRARTALRQPLALCVCNRSAGTHARVGGGVLREAVMCCAKVRTHLSAAHRGVKAWMAQENGHFDVNADDVHLAFAELKRRWAAGADRG